jgi:hypothetical protein
MAVVRNGHLFAACDLLANSRRSPAAGPVTPGTREVRERLRTGPANYERACALTSYSRAAHRPLLTHQDNHAACGLPGRLSSTPGSPRTRESQSWPPRSRYRTGSPGTAWSSGGDGGRQDVDRVQQRIEQLNRPAPSPCATRQARADDMIHQALMEQPVRKETVRADRAPSVEAKDIQRPPTCRYQGSQSPAEGAGSNAAQRPARRSAGAVARYGR